MTVTRGRSPGRAPGPIRAAIAGHPIAAFIAIVFASTWAMTGLLSISLMFGLVALFGPALGAVVVSWAEGSLGDLRQRFGVRRASPRLYLVALGLPLSIAAGAAFLWTLSGHGAPGIGTVSAIELVIFVLVVGEETGWRGFLLPRLRERLSLPAAGIVSGIVWSLWHLPIYLQPGQGLAAFGVFAWWTIPFALVMAFVVERARSSILVATVMHGAANISIPLLLPGVDRTWTLIATGALYLLFAGALVIHAAGTSRRSAAIPFRTKEVAA